MINPNVMPDDTNLSISGKWINKMTGDVIQVVNNVIDGDDMILVTDKGTISMGEFSNNYIQASEDIYDENGKKIGTEEIDTSQILNNINNIKNFNKTNINNEFEPIEEIKPQEEKKNVENTEINMLDKLFSKIKTDPEIKLTIKWEEFPKEEIKMLKTYFDITDENIGNYINNKYLKNDILNNAIGDFLKSL